MAHSFAAYGTPVIIIKLSFVSNILLGGALSRQRIPADFASRIRLQRLLTRLLEHLTFVDYRHPERSDLVVVVAVSLIVTFDERIGAELLQT